MYNTADFLLVQLSLSRYTLIKSARSSHVCLNYISTAQFYNLIIRISDVFITSVIIRTQNFNCHAQNRFWRRFRLAEIFSADFRRTKIRRLIRLSATAEGSTLILFGLQYRDQIWQNCRLTKGSIWVTHATSHSTQETMSYGLNFCSPILMHVYNPCDAGLPNLVVCPSEGSFAEPWRSAPEQLSCC